jgi:hypothetical protein
MNGEYSNEIGVSKKSTDEMQLVMYDSDKHVYDDFIDAIYIATGYDELQCEQLTLMINSKGFATIKVGHIDELKPMAETIQLEGFKVAIY